MSEETMSKSKQKREQRKAEAKAAKKEKNIDAIITWAVGIIIAAVVVGVIIAGIVSSVKSSGTTEVSADFSEGLTDDGFIKDAKLDKVDVSALEAITINYEDVAYTQEDCDKQIQSFLSQTAYDSTDSSLTVEDGSVINLDYVGYVDGVAFEGGNTNGAGTSLTIGSQSYIDDFEQQLIGSHPGDSVTVNVTFPDPYENNPDLAGKPATFECVINSISTTPEYNDEWVAANFSNGLKTTAELEEYVITTGYENNVVNYLSTYIASNADAEGAPKSYIKHLKAVRKYTDEQTYEYYNQYFLQMLGTYAYSSFEEYTGMTADEYEAEIDASCKKSASADITLEAYFKAKGLTVTDEDMTNLMSLYGSEAVTTYGIPFLRQEAVKTVALEELAKHVTILGK